jgi:hypothetical protein
VTRRLIGATIVALGLAGAPTGAAATPSLGATVVPGAPQFGDSFSYTVVLEVPAGSENAERSLSAPVAPFTSVAPTRVARSSSEGTTRVTVVQTLACLTIDCVPQGEARSVVLPAAQARIEGVTLVADRVTVRVQPRVASAAVAADRPVFREPGALPASTTRADPDSLAVVVAILAGAFGLTAVGALLGRRRRGDARPGHVDPLSRAIRLLRESRDRSSDDRRRAAALASRVVPAGALARDAERIAWERRPPAPSDASELADRAGREGVA